VCFFFDHIILPKPEQSGGQPSLEVFRQVLGCGDFFNRKELSWIDIADMILVAASQSPGGSRNTPG
jgi:dynein heavy chain